MSSSAWSARRARAARCRSGCGACRVARRARAARFRSATSLPRAGWWSRRRRRPPGRRRRGTRPRQASGPAAGGRCALSVDLHGIGGRLRALIHRVVAPHLGDAQPVGLEDATAALLLRLAVLLHVAPVAHRLLVTPERERDELALVADALEALDRDEAVEVAHIVCESLGERLVVGEASLVGREFEDDSDHVGCFPS